MLYIVTKQYLRGSETQCAEFNGIKEATTFIEGKMQDDAALNVKIIYRIHELGEVVKEFDPTKVQASAAQGSSSQASSSQGAQGKGAKSNFQPTPFNMAPRPGGTPPKWLKDDEEDKEKK